MLSSRPADTLPLPSKTPSRMKGRGENAIRPMTEKGKGKEAVARTPYHPTTLHPQKHLQDGSTAQPQLKPTIVTTRPTARPLGDKTPFPNRTGGQQFQTPLPQGSKLAGLSFLEPGALLQFDKTPDALLRPSSTRKNVRAPRSASKSFETPDNQGNHWDVSDVSIVMPEAQVQETIIEDDYDEIEYMAPNTLNLPYEPPIDFELPNYTDVGKALFNLAHSPHYDDTPVPEMDFPVDQIEMVPWDMFALPELGPDDDDPFHPTTLSTKTGSKVPGRIGTLAKNSRTPAVAPKPMPTSRSTAVTRAPSVASTTNTARATASRVSRPGTATSSTVPTSRTASLKTAAPQKGPATTAKPVSNVKARVAGLKPVPLNRNPITSTTSAVVRPKPSVSAIPPRPATSTATRSRTAGIATNTAATRRPTTSTSVYRPNITGPGSRLPTNRLTSASNGTKRPAVDHDKDEIIVRGDFDLEDDFRFDV